MREYMLHTDTDMTLTLQGLQRMWNEATHKPQQQTAVRHASQACDAATQCGKPPHPLGMADTPRPHHTPEYIDSWHLLSPQRSVLFPEHAAKQPGLAGACGNLSPPKQLVVPDTVPGAKPA